MAQNKPDKTPRRRMRGFEAAAQLVAHRIRAVSETRGFAVTRLLTHWVEVVGPDIAAHARPVKISHGKGFGATLTLLVQGARAPMISMQLEQIRERVNACYGYNAIARICVTQTAATGFSEGQPVFEDAAAAAAQPPSAETRRAAQALTSDVTDPALQAALTRLAVLKLARQAGTN